MSTYSLPLSAMKLWQKFTPGSILALGVLLHLALYIAKYLGIVDYGDNDVFQYVGWHITQGGELYTDSWDNKGPVVYVANALSLCLGQGAFKIFWTSLALALLFLCYRALCCAFSARPAAWGALAISIANVSIDAGGVGNRLEILASLFMACGLWLFLKGRQTREHPLHAFVQGVLVALLLLTKATYVGYGFFLLCYWLLDTIHTKKAKLYAQRMIGSATGFTLCLATCCLPFMLRTGGMSDMLDATICYNMMEYNQGGNYLSNFVGNLYKTWPSVSIGGLAVILSIVIYRKRWQSHAKASLITASSLWFLCELFLTSTVNTFFHQYLLVAVFPLVLLTLCLWENASHPFWLKPLIAVVAIFVATANLLFIARVQYHNLLNENKCNDGAYMLAERGLDKKGAVILGGAAVCRTAFISQLYATNTYTTAILTMAQSTSEKRMQDIAQDCCAAMVKPHTSLILSERAVEDLPWYTRSVQFRKALQQWQHSATLRYGKQEYVLYVYTRRD